VHFVEVRAEIIDDVLMASLPCRLDSRGAHVGKVSGAAGWMLAYNPNRLEVPLRGGQMESFGAGIGASVKEQSNNLRVPQLGRTRKRSSSVSRLCLDVGASIQ
jgi:hypothetical protein